MSDYDDDDDDASVGERKTERERERASERNVSVIRLPRCQSATVALYYVEAHKPCVYHHCGNLLTIVLLNWPNGPAALE